VLDDFHCATKARSGAFGKSPHGLGLAGREPLPIAPVISQAATHLQGSRNGLSANQGR
jgi:hypothetical protein